MQKLLLKLTGLGMALAVLLFSACDPESTTPTDPVAPFLQLVADPGFVDGDSDVEIGQAFAVKLRISKGDAKLSSVEISENGSKLATSRFSINSGAITSNNPFLVTGADQDGVTYEIDITAGSQAVGTATIYTFKVTDANGETDDLIVNITTVAPPGTPIESTLTGVLFNQAGPAGTGGLDLDTGTGTGSATAGSEIRDLGIDCTINPDNAENWVAKIGTINGADMRKVNTAQLENFTFAGVTKKESIIDAYTTGTTLADGVSQNPQCVETAVTDVSETVVVGDMFVVFANNRYYLIRVDAVNRVGGSNGDNYEMSIKF